MYIIDNHRMSIRDFEGNELKSRVAWHFVATLYLHSQLKVQSLGEVDSASLSEVDFFSRYNADTLRTSIARTVSAIDKQFPLLAYSHKSAGPWRLLEPASVDVFPSFEHLKQKLNYRSQNNQWLSYKDQDALFLFAKDICNGDCLLHTGHQKQACLLHYRKAATSKNILLKRTAKLRLCQALIRLGDFEKAQKELTSTDWGPDNSYAGVHQKLLKARLARLHPSIAQDGTNVDTSALPDDVSSSLARTLNAFDIRDSYMAACDKKSRRGTRSQLAHACLEELYNALFQRLRAYHYDGVQQSAYNIANAFHIMSSTSNTVLKDDDAQPIVAQWSNFCEDVCSMFEVGKDTYLNELLQAETLAKNPATQQQALAAAQSAYEKSVVNGNRYDQAELLELIETLSDRLTRE